MPIRRSHLEVCAQILEAIETAKIITKTHIMYRANISFSQLKHYMPMLLNLDLIREHRQGNQTVYEITEKGKLLLFHYHKVKELLKNKNSM
jgi:predicted transcriptional regulator